MLNKKPSTKFTLLRTLILFPLISLFLWSFNVEEKLEYVSTEKNQVSESYVVTRNSSAKELKSIEEKLAKDFAHTRVKFSEKRDLQNHILDLVILTKFQNESQFSEKMTFKKEDFPIQLVAENEKLKVIPKNNQVAVISSAGVSTDNKADKKLGENPLYIINGEKYTLEELTESEFKYEPEEGNTLDFKKYSPEEGIEKYGKLAKDGAIIIKEVASANKKESGNTTTTSTMSIKFGDKSTASNTNKPSSSIQNLSKKINEKEFFFLNGDKIFTDETNSDYILVENFTVSEPQQNIHINGKRFPNYEECNAYIFENNDAAAIEAQFIYFKEGKIYSGSVRTYAHSKN